MEQTTLCQLNLWLSPKNNYMYVPADVFLCNQIKITKNWLWKPFFSLQHKR